jgi:hypothetical protein
MRRGPHPPFSPDLASSDLYLFGRVKTALMSAAFSNENEPSHGVLDILPGISHDKLEAVFANSVARQDICVQRRGEYVEE